VSEISYISNVAQNVKGHGVQNYRKQKNFESQYACPKMFTGIESFTLLKTRF
jgi:hypothetical protein